MAELSKDDNVKDEQAEDIIKKSPFSDAVYSELAALNGKINQLSKPSLVRKLKQLKLETYGNIDVLRKRLKNHYRIERLSSRNLIEPHKVHAYFVIVDFEATCIADNTRNYEHEIIEFPAVLVNTENRNIEAYFQAYCKPVLNPKLSKFCINLTGITQEQVDSAKPFPEVLQIFEDWLKEHELGTKYTFAFVTDGPWDMGRFLYGQCKISGIPYPKYASHWVNIRKLFSSFYRSQRLCLMKMVEYLDIGFEGRPHCGLDDSRNIARILIRLITDGANVCINEKIQLKAGNDKLRGSNQRNELEIRVSPVKASEAASKMRLEEERIHSRNLSCDKIENS